MTTFPELDVRTTWILRWVGFCLLAFVFPVVLHGVLKGRFPRKWHFGKVTVGTWFLLLLFNDASYSAVMAYKVSIGVPGAEFNDGQADFWVLLLFGWAFPVVSLGSWFGLSAVFRRLRIRWRTVGD